jgi:hypothetical protein
VGFEGRLSVVVTVEMKEAGLGGCALHREGDERYEWELVRYFLVMGLLPGQPASSRDGHWRREGCLYLFSTEEG